MMKAMLASSSKTWLEEVQADSPIGLWLMQETTGTTLTATTGPNGTYQSYGITYAAAGPGKLALPNAASFAGTSGVGASVGIDLSALSVVTLEFWLKTVGADNGMLLEYSPFSNSYDSFQIFRAGTTLYQIMVKASAGSSQQRGITATYPTAGPWYHIMMTMDRKSPYPNGFYVNGVAQSSTPYSFGTAPTDSNFSNQTMYVMSRGMSSLAQSGSMAGLAVYPSILSAARIAAHFAGA